MKQTHMLMLAGAAAIGGVLWWKSTKSKEEAEAQAQAEATAKAAAAAKKAAASVSSLFNGLGQQESAEDALKRAQAAAAVTSSVTGAVNATIGSLAAIGGLVMTGLTISEKRAALKKAA